MKQYLDLLRAIKDRGVHKPAARQGMPSSQSLFGYQFRHDLSEGFPLLTTKKMFWKGVVVELLWFLRGDTNIKYLLDNGVNIWNEDAYNYYRKFVTKISQITGGDYSLEEFITHVKNNTGDDPSGMISRGLKIGDCGFQYGRVWRKWEHNEFVHRISHNRDEFVARTVYIDQIQRLITSLKTTPESRRHILTVIDPAHDHDLALYWCHAMVQFNCRPLTQVERLKWANDHNLEGELKFLITPDIHSESFENRLNQLNVPKHYLDCQLYQRSADAVLGVPFNIASYALLTHILCEICNMVPGEFIHSFGDLHIYEDHKASVEEQLKREPKQLPKLFIDNSVVMDLKNHGLDAVLEYLSHHSFGLSDYDPHPPLENKAELSTGLKK